MSDYPHIMNVQRESREWRRKAYPDTATIELQALGVAEESGELCHAVLKYKQGIRGYDRDKTRTEVSDAIGDIYIYMCGVADELEIDVTVAIQNAWQHVRDRNITQGSDAGDKPDHPYAFMCCNRPEKAHKISADGVSVVQTPEAHVYSKEFTAGLAAAAIAAASLTREISDAITRSFTAATVPSEMTRGLIERGVFAPPIANTDAGHPEVDIEGFDKNGEWVEPDA